MRKRDELDAISNWLILGAGSFFVLTVISQLVIIVRKWLG